MDKWLFIIGCLSFYLLFPSCNGEMVSNGYVPANGYETVMKEKCPVNDMKHRVEVICNDMKNSNCRTPRRNVQPSFSVNYRKYILHNIRAIYDTRVKDAGQAQKVSEDILQIQSSLYSSLLCCMGYHVYALRKIII